MDRPAEADAANPGEDPVDELVAEYILSTLRDKPIDLEVLLARLEPPLREQAKQRLAAYTGGWQKVSQAASQETPAVLGDFVIERELGRGGMGLVFLARQISLDRPVALKVMPRWRALSADLVERFQRESAALAQLQHPGIVPVLSAGEADGCLYFAMDYIRGAPLDQVLRDLQPLAVAQRSGADLSRILNGHGVADTGLLESVSYTQFVSRMGLEIAEALDHAHRQGVLHRDIKPANLLITDQGKPLLIDFGLARASSEAATLTRSTDLLGTPAYLPPEQILGGAAAASPQGDVYSLGTVLYEALAGAPPCTAPSVPALLKRIERGEWQPLHQRSPTLPRDLQTIVHKCLERSPQRRYGSATEVAADLQAFLAFRPIQARPPGALRRLWMLTRRNPIPALSALLVILALAAWPLHAIYRGVQQRQQIEAGLQQLHERIRRGELDLAEQQLQQLLAIHPELGERPQLLGEIAEQRCARAIEASSQHLDAMQELLGKLGQHLPELQQLERQISTSYQPEKTHRLQAKLQTEVLQLQRSVRQLAHRSLDQLQLAQSHAQQAPSPRSASLQRQLARYYYCEWLDAELKGEATRQAAAAERVQQHDLEGKYQDALFGRCTVHLQADSGSEVHLFRYRSLREVQPEAWQDRQVPVPFHLDSKQPVTAVHGVRPGDLSIQLQGPRIDPLSEQDLQQGDLVLSLGLHPAAQGLFVLAVEPDSAAADAGVQPFDRLDTVQGQSILSWQDLRRALEANTFPEVEIQWSSEEGRVLMETETRPRGPWLRSFGLTLGDAAAVLRDASVPEDLEICVLRNGQEQTLFPAAGSPLRVDLWRTAYPLLYGADSLLGTTPLESTLISAGDYLVVFLQTGHSATRLPFVARGGQTLQLEDKPPAEAALPGWVWVRGGKLEMGTDPKAQRAHDHAVVEVAGFWMARDELTVGEWHEFLADPAIQKRQQQHHAKTGEWIFLPRYLDQRQVYRRILDLPASCPISFLSHTDARAYLDWLNRRLQQSGSPFRAALPSEAQWLLAAGAALGRFFSWGDQFNPALCHSQFSAAKSSEEPVGSYPADESIYGIRDLVGGVSEVSADVLHPGVALLHGGSSVFSDPSLFRLQSRGAMPVEMPQAQTGIRLVFTLRPAKE